MRIYRKALILLLSLTIASFSALCGCSSKTATPSKSSSSELSDDTNDEAYQAAKEGGLKALGINPEKLGIKPVVTTDSTKQAGYQLDAPAEGETVAVVKTSMGNFRMRFFPGGRSKGGRQLFKACKKRQVQQHNIPPRNQRFARSGRSYRLRRKTAQRRKRFGRAVCRRILRQAAEYPRSGFNGKQRQGYKRKPVFCQSD